MIKVPSQIIKIKRGGGGEPPFEGSPAPYNVTRFRAAKEDPMRDSEPLSEEVKERKTKELHQKKILKIIGGAKVGANPTLVFKKDNPVSAESSIKIMKLKIKGS